MRPLRSDADRRSTAAILIAVLALMLSSAGGATAVTLITGKQIRNRSISGIDIRRHTITRTNLRSDVFSAASSIGSGANGANGANGSDGAAGKQGAAGAAGKDAFGTLDYNSSVFTAPSMAEPTEGHVSCPSDMHAIGGGVEPVVAEPLFTGDFAVMDSHPVALGATGRGTQAWSVTVDNQGDADVTVRVYVICAHANAVN